MSAPEETEEGAQGPSLSPDGSRNLFSFVTAAWNKYNGEMGIGDPVGIYMPKRKPAKLNESGKLVLPYCVHLPRCGIDRALSAEEGETDEDLISMGCGVSELDLSDNRLSTLMEVIKIIRFMPKLMFLDLTRNPLRASSVTLAAASIANEYASGAYIPSMAIKNPSENKTTQSPKECVCSLENGALKDCDCCDLVNGDNNKEIFSIICQRNCQKNESETRTTTTAKVDGYDLTKTVPAISNAVEEQSDTEYYFPDLPAVVRELAEDAHSPTIPVAESFPPKSHEALAEPVMNFEPVLSEAVVDYSPELSKTQAGSLMEHEGILVTTGKDELVEEVLQQRVISTTAVDKSSPEVSIKEEKMLTSAEKKATPDPPISPYPLTMENLKKIVTIDDSPEVYLIQEEMSTANFKEAAPEVFLEKEKMATIAAKEALPEVSLKEENMQISKTSQEGLMKEEKMPTPFNEASPEVSFKEESMPTGALKEASPEVSLKEEIMPTNAVKEATPEVSLKEEIMPTNAVKEATPEVSLKEETMPTKTAKEASPEVSLKEEIMPTKTAKETSPEVSLKEEIMPTNAVKEATPEVSLKEEIMPIKTANEASPEVSLKEEIMPIKTAIEASPEISLKEEIMPIKTGKEVSPEVSLKEEIMPIKTAEEASPKISLKEEIMPIKTAKEALPEVSLKQEETPLVAIEQSPDDTFTATERPVASPADENLQTKSSDSYTKELRSMKIPESKKTPSPPLSPKDRVTIPPPGRPKKVDLFKDELRRGSGGREQVRGVLDAKLSDRTTEHIAKEIVSSVITRSARHSLCRGSHKGGCQCVTGDRRPCCSSQLDMVDENDTILDVVVESVLSAVMDVSVTCEQCTRSSCPSTIHHRTTTLPAHLDPSESAKQAVKKDTDAARKTSVTSSASCLQKVRPGSARPGRSPVRRYAESELSSSSSQAKADSMRKVEAPLPSVTMPLQPQAQVETKIFDKSNVKKPQADNDTDVARGKKTAESFDSTEVVRSPSPTQRRPQSEPENAETVQLAGSTSPLEVQPEVEAQNADKIELLPSSTLTKVLPEATPDDEGNTEVARSSSPSKMQPMTKPRSDSEEFVSFIVPDVSRSSDFVPEESLEGSSSPSKVQPMTKPRSDSEEFVSFIVPDVSRSSDFVPEESLEAEITDSHSRKETPTHSLCPSIILSLQRTHSATQTDPEVLETSSEGSSLSSRSHSEENLSRNCSPSPESCPNRKLGKEAEPVMQPSLEALNLPNLRHLVLNGTGLGWTGVTGLLSMFRDLEELHLSLNDYTTVDLPKDLRYPSLRRLFFCRNPVREWKEWSKLGRAFPGLLLLFMAETDVNRLGEDSSIPESFPVLQTLSLSRAALDSWKEIDKLRLFPALHDVRLLNVPFLERFEPDERREQLLARLPNITQLNGSKVTDAERLDAEKDFIRLYIMEDDKPARYFELVKMYGELEASTSQPLMESQPPVSVTIRMGKQFHFMLAYPSQTILDFKRSLEGWTEMTPSRFVLLFKSKQAPEGVQPLKLKHLDTTIRQLDVHDGDEFIIEMKSHLE